MCGIVNYFKRHAIRWHLDQRQPHSSNSKLCRNGYRHGIWRSQYLLYSRRVLCFSRGNGECSNADNGQYHSFNWHYYYVKRCRNRRHMVKFKYCYSHYWRHNRYCHWRIGWQLYHYLHHCERMLCYRPAYCHYADSSHHRQFGAVRGHGNNIERCYTGRLMEQQQHSYCHHYFRWHYHRYSSGRRNDHLHSGRTLRH